MIERGSAILIVGVSGAGKSTVGRALAAALDVPFVEGDDFHPPANIEKMHRGIPLTDADRWPWLDALAAGVAARRAQAGVVATCSALRRRYRDRLERAIAAPLLFVCLTAERATLAARLKSRTGHFMPESLLDSQLATFEMPSADEGVQMLAADRPVAELVAALITGSSDDSTTSRHRTVESS